VSSFRVFHLILELFHINSRIFVLDQPVKWNVCIDIGRIFNSPLGVTCSVSGVAVVDLAVGGWLF
jgi:hypothetical protein